MDINLWIVIGTNLVIGGAIYGGIRADLKNMGTNIARLEAEDKELRRSSDKCHERLDSHIEHHHMGQNGHRRT